MVPINSFIASEGIERERYSVILITLPAFSMRDDRNHEKVRADCLLKAEALVNLDRGPGAANISDIDGGPTVLGQIMNRKNSSIALTPSIPAISPYTSGIDMPNEACNGSH